MKRKISLFLLMLVSIFTLVCANIKVSANSYDWNLVTDVEKLKAGDEIVIVAKNEEYALSTTQNSNNRASVKITKSEDKAIIDESVQIFTLEIYANNFAFNTGSGYIYSASSGSNYLRTESTLSANSTWTIEIDENGNATIKSIGQNTRNWLRFNTTNNPKIFSSYGSGQEDISIYKKEPALGSNANAEVQALFAKYYEGKSYIKESILNTKEMTDVEIEKYFHASASVKERTTWYYENGLTMYTKSNSGDMNYSTYENGNGKVEHTGLGGAYSVSKYETVEDMFYTLCDFNTVYGEGELGDWTYDSSTKTYSYKLEGLIITKDPSDQEKILSVSESKMTTMAREFVAPMWLAPNPNNLYVSFEYLQVQEIEDKLVMSLVVNSGDSGKLVSDANLVFSQVTIYKTDSYIHLFNEQTFKENNSYDLSGLNWTISTDGKYSTYDSVKGSHIGTGDSPASYIELISDSVIFANSISITTSGGSGTNATFDVKVGNTLIAEDVELNDYSTTYTFAVSKKAYGQVCISYSQETTEKPIYIKSIAYNKPVYNVSLPADYQGNTQIIKGDSIKYLINVEDGYRVSNVTVQNATLSWTKYADEFTVSNATGDVVVDFDTEVIPTWTIIIDNTTNGTITVSEPDDLDLSSVIDQTKVTFTFTPNNGYRCTSLKINGVAVANFDGESYSITVTENIQVSSVFETVASQVTKTISIKKYASDNKWNDSTKYTSINIADGITVTVTGSTNTGKYYINGYEWRIYQTETPKITFTASDNKKIVSVQITYNVSNSGVLTLNSDKITSKTVVTVNASTITFGVGNSGTKTNGQVKITSITVIYTE